MNLFFVTRDNRLVTPELTGSILEGVTRSSILELAKELGLRARGAPHPDRGVEGRRRERRDPRDLRVRHRGRRHARSASCAGRAAPRRRPPARAAARSPTPSAARSLDIQYGRAEDTHGWLTRLA